MTSPFKKSYSARLIEHLEISGDFDEKTLGLIKDSINAFGTQQMLLREQEAKENAGTIGFGKYKGRSVATVATFDKPYLSWMAKSQYSNQHTKDAIALALKE